MTYTFALDNIKIEGCNFKFKISKYIFLNKKKLPKFSFCVILLLWMTEPCNNSNTVTTHESQVEFIRYCAHLSSIPSLPPSPLPPLPGCSPAGGPVIPAAPLCRPAGISPASAEQRTQLTGSAVGAGGVLLLEAWLPYFLSVSQALLVTQNNENNAFCCTDLVPLCS